jgi:threonyl-tRNA synthetase
MRVLLFHCRDYVTRVERLSNKPDGIEPEEVKEREQKCRDCLVCLVTVEKRDDIKKVSLNLAKEISKMSREVGHKNVVLLPFAHLSNKLSGTKKGIKVLDLIEKRLKKKFKVVRAHFGSHKSLLLDVYGHLGNVRYREF